MKKIFITALIIVICAPLSAGIKPAHINLSGTWAFGTSSGNIHNTGIIIYQKDDKIFADMSVIATPPATGFFIDKKTVFLDFNNLGKFYGRVINDSYIEWTNNSFWQKRSGIPEKQSAELYDAKFEKAQSGSIKFTVVTKEEAVKNFNPKVFDNVKIASSDKLAKGGYASVSNRTGQPTDKTANYNPGNYREISITLSELPAWKMPYADGEGKYYYLIGQEKCDHGLELEQWYQERGFVDGSNSRSNFCGKKMLPGYQVFVKPVLFIWGKERTATEIAEMKKKNEPVQPSYSETYFKSSRYSDCMETCHKNQCRSKYNISESAHKACSDSCSRQCRTD